MMWGSFSSLETTILSRRVSLFHTLHPSSNFKKRIMTMSTMTVEESDRDAFDASPSMNGKGVYELGSSSGSHSNSHHSSVIVRSIKRENTSRHTAQSPSRWNHTVILPWSRYYKYWWGFLVICAAFTALFETYTIAFSPAGLAPYNNTSSIIDYILTAIYVLDILAQMNLAFYDEDEEIVYDRKTIAARYFKKMFWIDFLAVFPFYELSLAISGRLGEDSNTARYLAFLRLFRLLRLHRVSRLFGILQYNTNISLITLTLIRNFGAALVWAHVAACIFYFISRQYSHGADRTWLGDQAYELNSLELYVTSLYWSIVTFTTVGYGDWSPINTVEQIWSMIYMLINVVMQSWIIGSITLLIVKNDEKTGNYRDTLEVLDEYSKMHSFPKRFHKSLRTQLKLDFDNQEVADEHVLKHFPTSTRRKVLRRLYLPYLKRTGLMRGVRQQFVDEFLTTCTVEIFCPGEDILERNSISSHLYLLVEGRVGAEGRGEDRSGGGFINQFGFFTESPEIERVRTKTICKTLTMSRSAYKMISQDHPGSAGKILQNLLAISFSSSDVFNLPQPLSRLRAGSVFFVDDDPPSRTGSERDASASPQSNEELIKIQDLVRMHISKQHDDHTTRFLFAASRGDINTISLMTEQGFDPNSSDYDSRTALMVAAMKGNTEVVKKLLDYNADPNLTDMHGSTALYEAARNGNEEVMEKLVKGGAELCMKESLAASILCQAIYVGDVILLRRLLKAGINIDAVDYDKRAAVHIAAAEGNVAALKVLVEYGANLDARDRWGNTASEEAKSAKATLAGEFLSTLKL